MPSTSILQKILLSLLLVFLTLPLLAKEDSNFPHPIDIVYLWVDGSDPNWLAIKNIYLPEDQKIPIYIADDACSDNRFLDHEELKYSLRSLLAYAPFFNHIYIVTMNQRPKWLLDHPQITIVDHSEIFQDINNLPTFNSQSIEANIHRIQGLSEYFIYFNDDVLLGKKITPFDFFSPEGKIKVLFEKGLTFSSNPLVQASLYRKAWINSNALLNTNFKLEKRHRLCHAPFALRQSCIESAENQFPYVFSSNSSHPFRCDKDFNITNGLLQYIWLYQDLVLKGNLTNKMISLHNDEQFEKNKEQLESFQKKPRDTFCIQDCMVGESQKTCRLLKNFFEELFPTPAPWESLKE